MTNSKITLIFSLLICVCASSFGCPNTGTLNLPSIKDIASYEAPSDSVMQSEEYIYKVVEEMPSFVGGAISLHKFISENITYPKSAKKNGIEGKVTIKFCVEKDGSISNINVYKSLCPECDAEAIRVIKAMPKWKPGKQNGRAVRVWYTLPLSFKLSGDKTNTAYDKIEKLVSEVNKELPVKIPEIGITIIKMQIMDNNLMVVIQTDSTGDVDSVLQKIKNNDKSIYSLCCMDEGLDLLCKLGYGLKLLVLNNEKFKNAIATIPSERLKEIYSNIQKEFFKNLSFLDVLQTQMKSSSFQQINNDKVNVTRAYIKNNNVYYVMKIDSKIKMDDIDENLLKSTKKTLIDKYLELISKNDKWKGEIKDKNIQIHLTYKNKFDKAVMDFVLTYDDFFAR